jgi:hypothetical protein
MRTLLFEESVNFNNNLSKNSYICNLNFLKQKNMIKQLLTILSVATVVTVSAQTGKIANPTKITQELSNQSFNFKASATPTTVLLSPFSGTSTSIGLNTASSDTATPGCSPLAGYVFGSNCYDDLEKAQYFPTSSYSTAVSNASITGAVVYLFKNGTRGCSSSTNNPTSALKIYSGTSNTVMPGSLLGQQTVAVSSMIAAQTGTPSFFTYTFTLTTPISISAGFYASVVTPTLAGDTVVMGAQTGTLAAVNNAWEKWSNGSWNGMNPAWGTTFKGNIAIFPIISGSVSTVGLNKVSNFKNNVSILPNPTSGDVKINLSLAETSNITINITNAIGQVLEVKEVKNVQFDNVAFDLSKYNNGIYFVTVSNGTEKMVQRLIINK